MNIGTSEKKQEDNLAFPSKDVVYLEMGKNIHRLLEGPCSLRIAFYPTTYFDKKKQEEISVTLPFVVEKDSIFDKIGIIDKKIRVQHCGEQADKVRSPLSPVNRVGYVIFNRKDAEPKRKFIYYPNSVGIDLRNIQRAIHPEKADKMRNCFLFMWDVEITKYFDENPSLKKTPGGGIRYKTEFMPGNRWEGKLPASYLSPTIADEELIYILSAKSKKDGKEIYLEKKDIFNPQNFFSVFTKEELEILDTEFDSSDYTTALSNVELMEKFQTLKFNIAARDKNGNYKFPEKERLAKEIIDLGLIVGEVESKQLPQPKEKATDDEINVDFKPENPDKKEISDIFDDKEESNEDLPF